jgi:selenium metabolism protein YedF
MSRVVIDARGLACPHPVVLTNKAIEEAAELTTIVDNEVARENVSRLAESKGFQVEVEEKEGAFHLHLTRGSSGAEDRPATAAPAGPIVLLIASDAIGRGSEELGRTLMTSFVQILGEISPRPERIVFMNSGVKLVAEGSAVLEDLRALEQQGIELLACGTCLAYFDLKEKIRVGQVSDMFAIASALHAAGRVVSP